MVNGLTSDL